MQNFSQPIQENEFYGLRNDIPAEQLPKGFLYEVENAFISDSKIEKVYGASVVLDKVVEQKPVGIGAYESPATATKILIFGYNGASASQLYKWTGTGAASSIASMTSVNDKPFWFEMAGGYLFALNGSNVFDFDGTTMTKDRAGIPIGSFNAWYHNYNFIAGHAVSVNRVWWSDLGTATTYTASNYTDISPGDGDYIVNFGKIQDELVVFKTKTIHAITGWSGASFSASTIQTTNTNTRITGYGLACKFGAVSFGHDIYYVSLLNGVPVIRSLVKTRYATTLAGGIISKPIEETMARINLAAINKIVGWFDGRYVKFAVPLDSSTVNNAIIMIDTMGIRRRDGSTFYPWTLDVGKKVSHVTISSIGGSATEYYQEENTEGDIVKIDKSVFSNKGEDIPLKIITKTYQPESGRKQKWVYQYIKTDVGVNSTLNISAKLDEGVLYELQAALSLVSPSPGLDDFVLDRDQLDGSNKQKKRVVFKSLTGHGLSLKFEETSSNPVGIYDWEIFYRPKGLRGT